MRKLMWFTVGFGISCAFLAYFEEFSPWKTGLFSLVVLLGILVLLPKIRQLRITAAVMLGLTLGCMLFQIHDTAVLEPVRTLDGQTVRKTVIVTDYSYETDYGCGVDGTVELEGRYYQVRLYLDRRVALEPGNRVIGEFSFQKTTGGGKEELLYHQGRGIFLRAYQESNIVVERCWSTPLRCYPAIWMDQLCSAVEDAFRDEEAAFARALLLGDRTDVDYETNTAFKVSGISHIIAVSGLHVNILFSFLCLLTLRRRSLSVVLGMAAVWVFAAVTGFTPSVTRAAVMHSLMLTASLCMRRYDGPTALSFAALILLLWNPLTVCSVSFQLSFACVAGILCFSEPIGNWLLDGKRLGRWRSTPIQMLASSLAVSLSAAVFTTPLVAYYFGTVSLVSPLTNLLTLWVITIVFCGVAISAILGLFAPAAASFVGAAVAWPIRYVLAVSKWLSSFPLAVVYTKSVYIVAWLVFVYILLAVFLVLRRKPVSVFTALTVGMLCVAVGLSWAEPRMDDYRLTMLDVGQGQAILLQGDGRTYLVDCGGSDDEAAADTVAETLMSQGIYSLDGVILTHYDRDHSGGVPYLLERMDVKEILLPYCYDENGVAVRLREAAGDRVRVIDRKEMLCWGESRITLFVPESYHSGNESCMCILFQRGNCDILITGDRSEVGERLLVKYQDLPDVDVLIAGHHGADSSTTQLLLDAVQPEYVLISAGEGNRYGHPEPALLRRLWEFGCIVLRTDENGTITIRG